jgi:uroporphyrinogen decarboxylase
MLWQFGKEFAMSTAVSPAYQHVGQAFAHVEGRVPLWAIIINRPVYEHVLGAVADGSEAPLEDKIALHARVYRELGIELTRAFIWPPDRLPKEVTPWTERNLTADQIATFQPKLPEASDLDQDVALRCRQVELNRPHTVFAPTIRGLFCPVYEQMGLEEFSYACADAPAQVERLMDVYTQHAAALASRYAVGKGVSYIAICDDMAYKNATIFPPAWMREHWIPRLAQVVAPLKQAGIRVIFHSDGDVRALVPDLIAIGIDALNPLEPLAGMDLAQLKRDFGGDLTLIGGVDCSQLLPYGKPRQIRDEVRRLLDIGRPGGGFIIGDSSNISPNTPLENVLAFFETVREQR